MPNDVLSSSETFFPLGNARRLSYYGVTLRYTTRARALFLSVYLSIYLSIYSPSVTTTRASTAAECPASLKSSSPGGHFHFDRTLWT